MTKIKKEYAILEFVERDGLSVDVIREFNTFETEEAAISRIKLFDYGEYYIVPKYTVVGE